MAAESRALPFPLAPNCVGSKVGSDGPLFWAETLATAALEAIAAVNIIIRLLFISSPFNDPIWKRRNGRALLAAILASTFGASHAGNEQAF
jgi:hypothetical protein